MAITFRTSKGAALTHVEMDENFSSVYFSSSIHDISNSTSKELKLWFDTDVPTPVAYHSIELPAPGGGTVTVDGNQNNNVLTATGGTSLQGESNLTFNGSTLNLTGLLTPVDQYGNISIGIYTGVNAIGGDNVLVGNQAGQNLGNTGNVAVGNNSLVNASGQDNTSVGGYSLLNLNGGDGNTALGYSTAQNVGSGQGNLYLGYQAGPATSTPSQDNKLYINNSPDDTPLILGDFATGQVTFNSQVSASVFSGSFVGDGSTLTGVSTEWDGTRDGNAEITGSLIVSGGVGSTVDFTNVSSISGSIFSGSFVGDGSGLTGIVSTSEWDGTRDGNAEITGSFIVSGSSPTINLKGVTTIDENIKIHNPDGSSIGIGESTLNSSPNASVALGAYAGIYANNSTTLVGYSAGQRAGEESTYVGYLAGAGFDGSYSTGIGSQVLAKARNSSHETALGYKTLFKIGASDGSGLANVAIGSEALTALEKGAYNVVVGAKAFNNLLLGRANVAIGYEAGSPRLDKGDNNVYLGPFTGRDDVDYEENQLYIDNQRTNDALIRGDFGQRTLTLNALQVIIPNLPKYDTPEYDALPVYGLYRDGNGVFIKLP